MSEKQKRRWPALRLVAEGICTWTEVTTTMSIADVLDMNEVLDAVFDAKNAPQPGGAR